MSALPPGEKKRSFRGKWVFVFSESYLEYELKRTVRDRENLSKVSVVRKESLISKTVKNLI